MEKITPDTIMANNMNPEKSVWPRRQQTVLKWISYFKNKFSDFENL
jgi:hypothetical protein